MQGWERANNTQSVRRPHPRNANPLSAERREMENCWRQKWSDQLYIGNKKTSAMFLKLSSPPPSNTGSPRSFHRDTDRRIKVKR